MHSIMKIASLAGLLAGSGFLSTAWACTCSYQLASAEKDSADVIFAGRVEEVTLVDPQSAWEPRVVVRFSVRRAWKGPVTETFTMYSNFEASSCAGFFRELLQPGKTLLVYGRGAPAKHWKAKQLAGAPNAKSYTQLPDDSSPIRSDLVDQLSDNQIVYTTDTCTRTMPVEYAVEEFTHLGKPRELGPLDVLPDAALALATHPKFSKLPNGCGEFRKTRIWNVMGKPPANHAALTALLESKMYASIPQPPPTRYRDYWVSNSSGFGLCRLSVDPKVVCGQAIVSFSPKSNGANDFTVDGAVQAYCKNPDGSRYEPP